MIDKKLQIKNNLLFVLADVCDSLLIDIEEGLNKEKLALKREDKQNISNLIKQIKLCRSMASKSAKILYENCEVDEACKDSDYLLDLLLLIVDRIGEDKNREAIIRASVFNFSSKLGIY